MVNLDELRKKYEEVTSPPGQGSNTAFLKKFLITKEGTSVVRILPWKDEDKEFYAETAIHRIERDGQFKNYHCPRTKGDSCPICDVYFGLWKTENEANHNLARKIKARKRFYLNAVDRDSSEVKILSMGQKLFGKILDCFFDEDYGDLTDVKAGWDFKVIKDMTGPFPNYDKSLPKPQQTPAGTDAEVATWMDELHDIHNLVKIQEYNELKQVALEIESISKGITMVSDDSPSNTNSTDDDYLSHLKNLKTD